MVTTRVRLTDSEDEVAVEAVVAMPQGQAVAVGALLPGGGAAAAAAPEVAEPAPEPYLAVAGSPVAGSVPLPAAASGEGSGLDGAVDVVRQLAGGGRSGAGP